MSDRIGIARAQGGARGISRAHPDIQAVQIMITDPSGVLRGKAVRREELERIFDSGRQVAGSILGLDITGKDVDDTGLVWDTGDADMTARPIARTLKRAPWLAAPTGQLMLTMFDGAGPAGRRGSAPRAGARGGAVRAHRDSRPWWPASSSSIY